MEYEVGKCWGAVENSWSTVRHTTTIYAYKSNQAITQGKYKKIFRDYVACL